MGDAYHFLTNEAAEIAAGEEHGEASGMVSATVVFVILSFLFVVTMAFEHGKEHLLEHTSPRLIPIVETLFSELTVLGFLGVIVFCVSKMGILQVLSLSVLGEKEELTEVLETVHYILFGVMVIFVMEVLLLIHAGNYLEAEWLEMNDDVQSPRFRERTEKELETIRHPKWYERGHDRIEWERLIRGLIFNSLRTEFILGRQVLAPFSRLPSNEQLNSDFRFDRYLTLSLSHTIQHIIEVPNTTWLFMWGVIGLYYILMLIVGNSTWVMAWIWLGLGYLLGMGMSKFYSYFIYQVLIGMIHPDDITIEIQNTRANLFNNIVTDPEKVGCSWLMGSKMCDAEPSEKVSLMKGCDDATNYGDTNNDGMMGPSTLKRRLPLWCTFNLPHLNQRPLILKQMMGFHPNRQQLLFPFQEHGPHTNIFALRLILLGQAVYGAVMVFVFADAVWIHSNLIAVIFYLTLGVIPIVFIGLNLAKIVQCTVLVNNVGCNRSEKFVASVVRDQKASRALCTLMLLNKLRIRGLNPSGAVQDNGKQKTDGSISASRHSLAEAVRKKRLEFWGIQEDNGTFKLEHIAEELSKRGIEPKTIIEISEMFDAYDVDHSGTLDSDETISLISAMGHPVDELRAQEIMLHLDLDNDGAVSRDEFIAWSAENIIKQVEGETPVSDEDVVLGLFKLFDKDGSGEITVEEFKNGLDNLNAGLSMDEIVDLMKEIDHTPDGRISEHEFERLFAQHCSASNTSH